MIGTVKECYSNEFINFIIHNQHTIKNTYAPVEIVINKSMRWITVYCHESRRRPVISYIKRSFPEHKNNNNEQIPETHKLRIKSIPIPNAKCEGALYTQMQAFIKSPQTTLDLFNFITKNEYCVDSPMIRQTNKHDKYHIKWNIPDDKIINEIRGIWYTKHPFINIHKCGNNSWIANLKNNAIMALNQSFKYAVTKLKTNNISLIRYKSFLIKHIMKQNPDNDSFKSEDLPKNIQTFPFLQYFTPEISPLTANIISLHKLKIAFLNIQGSARDKITHNHPWIHQIISKHKPDIIALVDTGLFRPPTWKLNGFKFTAFKAAIQTSSTNKKLIGGILIYRKHNLSSKINIIHKEYVLNSIWISIENTNDPKPIYLSINYITKLHLPLVFVSLKGGHFLRFFIRFISLLSHCNNVTTTL